MELTLYDNKDAAGTAGLTGTGQYALGCAAFEMLCGEPPFRRDHSMAEIQGRTP